MPLQGSIKRKERKENCIYGRWSHVVFVYSVRGTQVSLIGSFVEASLLLRGPTDFSH